MIGNAFDHKTFIENYPKILQEFLKRINPDLPFIYWTGVNNRFKCAKLQSFNVPTESGNERLDKVKIQRRADPGVFVSGRVNLPQRGKLSLRAEFHSAAEKLPPTC